MQKFRLWWTYHSNAIEGNKLTQGETETFLMEGLTAKGKPLKDHLDLRGHNDAINFLFSLVKEKQSITESDIRGLHKILLMEPYPVDAISPDGKPTTKMVAVGEYKTSANHVKTRTGEIHYYATPEETAAKMHDLMEWYRKELAEGVMHPVEIASRFHHQFTAIHPFDDGNGRMSRLLMNLMLMQGGYPPTVVRLGERDDYLAALRRADRGEYEDFITLIGEHVVESLNLFIEGAQGKDVSEPTDLRKEIELELLRLEHIEEPVARSRELLYGLYKGSFNSLVTEAVNQLAPFCKFFTDGTVHFQTEVQYLNSQISSSYTRPFADTNFSEHLEECFGKGREAIGTQVQFRFASFRKGRFDTFDLTASLKITCEPLKYSVHALPEQGGKSLLHFYQEPLTKDEITSLVEPLARYLLKTIQEKTKTS